LAVSPARFKKQAREPGCDFRLNPLVLDLVDFPAKLWNLIESGELKAFEWTLRTRY
jgi:hypothetical protein